MPTQTQPDLPLEPAYEVDFERPGWLADWTVILGNEPVEPATLGADGLVMDAEFGRAIDPRAVRVKYTATMLGPDARGDMSDLSCHIGNVCFCFGGQRNTFTGITVAGTRAEPSKNQPMFEPGRRYEVTAEIRGCDCRLYIDGALAAAHTLDEPLREGIVRLYTWAGLAAYHHLELSTPGGLEPLKLCDTATQRETYRRHLNATSLTWIEHRGKFLHECSLPGEGREVGFYPAHPNGIQLSKDRCLLLYTTRAYVGNDDERSGIYQLRADRFDGPILKEGWITQTTDQWDPLGDGKRYVLQNGHPTAFGVPKGALIQGKRVAHENVFAVLWRIEARWVDPATGYMVDVNGMPELKRATQCVMWTQCRLNDAGDDIEIVQPAQPLRMVGYEDAASLCSNPHVKRMNAAFVPAVPINDDCSQWANCNTAAVTGKPGITSGWQHDYGAVVPLRYQFNPQRGLYEWTDVGPLIGDGLFEASVVRYRDRFLIAARRGQADGIAWAQTDDLFGPPPNITLVGPGNRAPLCAFACPDGVVRRTGGHADLSPYGQGRDPIYIIDVDPDNGFVESNARVIYDGRAAHVPIPTGPIVDFAKVLPHLGGSEQLVLHRLRSGALNDPTNPRINLSPVEMEVSGIYAAKLHYREPLPGVWTFA